MEEGEAVVLKVHRHWLFIVVRIFGLALLMIAPSVIVRILESLGILDAGNIPWPASLALWSLWGLVLWSFFWQFWTTYYMDIWVVTNRRIIDIDYQRLFDRNIAMLKLDRIQDVTTHVQGIIGTLFKYGSVHAQTAGSDKEFVIDQISNPETLRDAISKFAGPSGGLGVVRVD